MAWRELQVVLPRRSFDAASRVLFALGCAGVQEDHVAGEAPPPRQPWDRDPPPAPTPRALLRAWFDGPDEAAVASRLTPTLPTGSTLSWHDVPEEDWETSWQDGFGPVEVAPGLVVAPPWDAPDGALLIEPGQGFGTGQHPTTLAALRFVAALAPGLTTALDVGTGSGILALAAARAGLTVTGIDVDADALADAERNARRNGLSVALSQTPIHQLTTAADLVLANLYAEVLVELAPHLIRLTRRHVVLAGILADREASVRAAFATMSLAGREVDGEWVCLHLVP